MSVLLMNANSSNELETLSNPVSDSAANAKEASLDPNASFAWVKVYSMVALWSMANAMINNGNAIQEYIYNGLQQLSLAVMDTSKMWSTWGINLISADQQKVQSDMNIQDPQQRSAQINVDTTTFNTDNTVYQQFLQWFNSMNDGINNTSSNATQTQTQDNSNITQGPCALLQTMTNIWTVIA